VLCLDEKSSVQALDRTQASLPIKKGRAATMTHDYKRNGTTTLFAALDVLTGTVIGQCLPRHRPEEFLKFLRTIEREVPAGLAVHLICDNYATHKHPAVRAWLAKHPRFHMHFRRLPLCLGDRPGGAVSNSLGGARVVPRLRLLKIKGRSAARPNRGRRGGIPLRRHRAGTVRKDTR